MFGEDPFWVKIIYDASCTYTPGFEDDVYFTVPLRYSTICKMYIQVVHVTSST